MQRRTVFPFAGLAKGTLKIAEKRGVATAILQPLSGETLHRLLSQIPLDNFFGRAQSQSDEPC
jgi:hypothetical protein